MAATTISWPDLPKELLVSIAKCLETRSDVNRFRAVCSSWRSSISPPQKTPPPLPLILPFPVYNCGLLRPERRGYFQLSETTIFCVQEINSEHLTTESSSSRNEWLIRVKETETGKVQIQDPFGRQIFQFPPHKTPSKVLDLLKFHVSEITKVYDLQYVDVDDIPVLSVDEDAEAEALTFHKVILSSKPVSNAHDYAIVAINYVGILCYTKLGDDKWRTMLNVDFNGRSWHLTAYDIVEYKGHFYVVDRYCHVFVLNYSFEVMAILPSPTSGDGLAFPDGSPHLVSIGGDLFSVNVKANAAYDCLNIGPIGDIDATQFHITVYKLDDEQQKWEEMRSLSDWALFLCFDGCFPVTVQDFAGLERGFIYFLDYYCGLRFEEHKIPIWVFSIEDSRCWRLPHKLF